MRVTPHTGAVQIMAGGDYVALRFDWSALSRLRHEFGTDFDQQMEDAFASFDMDVIAKILATCSDKDAAWWIQASPPILPTSSAVRSALTHAFLGAGSSKKDPILPNRLQRAMNQVIRTLSKWHTSTG